MTMPSKAVHAESPKARPVVVSEAIKATVPSLPPHRREAEHLRIREVSCLTKPLMHVEGDHVLNFTTDTLAMLDSTGDHISIRDRRFLEQALRKWPKPSLFRPGAKVLTMTDRQWAAWDRLRGVHLIDMRRGSKGPFLAPLSIPMPETAQ